MLCKKPNIQSLQLNWRYQADERENGEYKDEMEGLKPHTNIKELRIGFFKGKNFASWITMMTNLVKITVKDCERCELLPPLGNLPKLREMDISYRENLKFIESHFSGGLESDNSELSGSRAAKTVTTMYPSLRKLILKFLPRVEEFVQPVNSAQGVDQSTVIVFPKLEVLEIRNCPRLRGIPDNCFPTLKKFVITKLESGTILETMSRKASSLTHLQLSYISSRRGDSSSTSNIDEVLKNNSKSLKSLGLDECEGLTCLTLSAAVVELKVVNCPDLVSISVAEGSSGLKELTIGGCPALSQWVFVQSMSSSLTTLSISIKAEELDRFPWSFSSAISFPTLTLLFLTGGEEKSMMPYAELEDRLSSTFPASTGLYIISFDGVKALPDYVAKIPSLKKLHILDCKNMDSLPMFDQSHSLGSLRIDGCPILKERCRKRESEWFKIQHIPDIEIDGIGFI